MQDTFGRQGHKTFGALGKSVFTTLALLYCRPLVVPSQRTGGETGQ